MGMAISERVMAERVSRMMGLRFQGTEDEARAFVELLEEINLETGAHLSITDSRMFSKTRDALANVERQKRQKRRAGAKALQSKYGYDAADRIAQQHGFAGKLQR